MKKLADVNSPCVKAVSTELGITDCPAISQSKSMVRFLPSLMRAS